MGFFAYGAVSGGARRPHPAASRFVAFLDVLGMKSWLQVEGPREIAEKVDQALYACDQSSQGNYNGHRYGPLIGTAHFSDSLLAWSPDDSWVSLVTMCAALKLIVGTALCEGVPLRGALAHGEAVCSRRTSRFVGRPLVDAYECSESKTKRYRSVGVQLTPATVKYIQARVSRDPVPSWLDRVYGGLSTSVIAAEQEACAELIWFDSDLYVNHWDHGLFGDADTSAMFRKRNLPGGSEVEEKVLAMVRFYETSRSARERYRQRLSEVGKTFGSEMVDLVELRKAHIQLDALIKKEDGGFAA